LLGQVHTVASESANSFADPADMGGLPQVLFVEFDHAIIMPGSIVELRQKEPTGDRNVGNPKLCRAAAN